MEKFDPISELVAVLRSRQHNAHVFSTLDSMEMAARFETRYPEA